MKSQVLFFAGVFTLMFVLPVSAAKYYLYTGADPWGARSDGAKVEVPEGMFHLMVNSFADADEVWIAAGTYTTSSTPDAISLKEGMSIYGGFFGNETAIDQRQLADETGGNGVAEPWEFKYPTVIQGTGTAGSLAGYVMITGTTNYTLDGVTLENHYALVRFGGAIYNSSSTATPVINKCTFRNIHKTWSTAGNTGGGLVIYVAGPTTISSCLIENSVLYANAGMNSGYGGVIYAAKSATITGNVLRNNNVNGGTYVLRSGGISVGGVADTNVGTIANNVLYNNTCAAGVIYFGGSGTAYNVVNNTLVNNFASGGNSAFTSGMIYIPANAKIYNNVVFNNTLGGTTTSIKSFSTMAGAAVDLQNNAYNGGTNIQSGGSFVSLNNITPLETPNFVNPSTTIGYTAVMPADVKAANFALSATSTDLIDHAGYFAGVTPSVDILGNPRSTTPGTIDIGAYEYISLTTNGPRLESAAQVYVNAGGRISIIAPEKCSYAVYTVMGQEIDRGVVTGASALTGQINKGMYVVRLNLDGKEFTSKVIVQ